MFGYEVILSHTCTAPVGELAEFIPQSILQFIGRPGGSEGNEVRQTWYLLISSSSSKGSNLGEMNAIKMLSR